MKAQDRPTVRSGTWEGLPRPEGARARGPARRHTIERIVVPLDGSRIAELALPHAAALAKAFKADLRLLSVTEPAPGTRRDADGAEWRLGRAETRAYLEGVAERISKLGIDTEWNLADGSASEQILRFAEERRADVIVLCSHGRGGITEFDLSGTASKVLNAAGCSVLVVRARATGPTDDVASYGRVLVGVDCTKRSEWAVNLAGTVARAQGAELVLGTVIPRPDVLGDAKSHAEAKRLVEGLCRLNRQAARKHLERLAGEVAHERLAVRQRTVEGGDVARGVEQLAEAEDCSLIVLTAHGGAPETGRPFGSVSLQLLEHATKPVLVLQDVEWKRRGHPTESASNAVSGLPTRWT